MAGRLQDKVAVVTGGASGIGEGMVRRFCSEGASVLLADIDEPNGAAIAAECGAEFIMLDVSQPDSWHQLQGAISDKHGRLDTLVNNAGIVSSLDITAVTVEAWQRLMSINLTGVMLGCQMAIALMRENPVVWEAPSLIPPRPRPFWRYRMSRTPPLKQAWWV